MFNLRVFLKQLFLQPGPIKAMRGTFRDPDVLVRGSNFGGTTVDG